MGKGHGAAGRGDRLDRANARRRPDDLRPAHAPLCRCSLQPGLPYAWRRSGCPGRQPGDLSASLYAPGKLRPDATFFDLAPVDRLELLYRPAAAAPVRL